MDTKAKNAALDRILELSVLVNDDMNRSLPQDGLTPSRAHLLWELLHRGPSTQRILADALKVSARTITGLIDGLVATDFVTREPHPADRRATLVTFTPHGRQVAEKMKKGQREFADILFDGMPAERFAHLVEGLDDVLARLRQAIAAHTAPATTAGTATTAAGRANTAQAATTKTRKAQAEAKARR